MIIKMYNCKYRRCCCQKSFDNNMLQDACNNCGVVADYYNENNKNSSCDCGFEESENVFPTNPMFGQSYVPIQTMNKTFTPCVGLKMGTIFPELVSPYVPCQSIGENAFIKAMNTVGEGCNKCY